MFGFKFLGNTHIPHRKNTAEMPPVKMAAPKEVLIPISQHIGAPATPVVKVGDEVKVGQLIAEPAGYVSAPIHAPISGKVIKIEGCLFPDGKEIPSIRIENDGLMTVSEEVVPPQIHDLDSFIEAIKKSGLVGLGGAGFPTGVKLDATKKGGIHTIIINAAECEPYITCDHRTMIDNSDLIFEGITLLEQYIPSVKKFIFGIEKNKPQCIKEMEKVFKDDPKVSVAHLPTLYPQGAERVIIYNTTGIAVPKTKLPAEVGVLVMNVTTLTVLAKYMKTGMPLIEKCITVDGSAVKEPKNIIAPVGTPIRDVLEFVGVDFENIGKVLFGGPMTGISVCSLDEPIGKRTNALTVLTVEDSMEREASACIHCGKCVDACPMFLNPTALTNALALPIEEKMASLEDHCINLCMECGCCSYVCPANRPLIQNNRLAKAALKAYQAYQATLK